MDNKNIAYDLSNCDKEPIHLIGKIQNVGSLIAISKKTLEIVFVSDNVYPIFNVAPEALFNQNIKHKPNLNKQFCCLEQVVSAGKN